MELQQLAAQVQSACTGVEQLTGVNAVLLLVLVSVLIASLTFCATGERFQMLCVRLKRGLLSDKQVDVTALNAVRYITERCPPGQPEQVLACVLDFMRDSEHPVIHLGEEKGLLLDELIVEHKPTVVLELGAYFGYTAIRMARLMAQPEAKLYTLEVSEECTAATRQLLQFCGLQGKVEVINEAATEGIANLRARSGVERVDFVFIDHWKDVYLRDLRALEQSGLMYPGTVIVADNMIYPGVPDYLAYVTGEPQFATKLHTVAIAGKEVPEDAVAMSTYLGPGGGRRLP